MDAREKWKNGVLIAVKNYGKACAHNAQSPDTFRLQQAQEAAYVAVCNELRTTPEGFALVPVPEWVPVDGRALPGLMRGGDYWIVRGARVYLGGTIDLRDPDATHYQIALPPAPPKSEPL